MPKKKEVHLKKLVGADEEREKEKEKEKEVEPQASLLAKSR
jgi:hypothetical protein